MLAESFSERCDLKTTLFAFEGRLHSTAAELPQMLTTNVSICGCGRKAYTDGNFPVLVDACSMHFTRYYRVRINMAFTSCSND